MATAKYSDEEARGLLLDGARTLVADMPGFTLASLFTATGVSRAQFRRCFDGKAQLLAALTQNEVRALDQILDVAQPVVAQEQELRAAIGSNTVPAVQTDAWLERRLRVFERALAGLEKRQEKFELGLAQRLALMDERAQASAAERAIAAAALPAEAAPLPVSVPVPQPAPDPEPELDLEPQAEVELESGADIAVIAAALTPAVLAQIEMIAAQGDRAVVQPAPENATTDFVAQARQAAQAAAIAQAAAPSHARHTRQLLAWGGVVLTFMLLCAGLLFASGLLGHAAGAMPMAGVSHRQVAQNGVARVIALADSGDAGAETVLALAYLRGEGVAADEVAARRWSGAAAAQGEPVAQYLLGTFYLKADPAEAVRWFRSAAEQGNLKAMHNLAIAYAQGVGVASDPLAASRWFMRAAAQGYRDSQFDLAVLYERGMGVPQSGAAALKWYLVAAANGDGPSAVRAAMLKDQIAPADVQVATQAASGFTPRPAARAANDPPRI